MKESELPNYLYFYDIPQNIKDNLIEIEIVAEKWMKLYENRKTGQLWAIDVWDKYDWQVAFKIDKKEELEKIDFTKYRKELLLKSRGGLQNKNCICKGCTEKRVRDVVYCIDHLYDTGARK